MTDLPIVDAHHHIWRRADLPWLNGPMVPRIFGPYEAVRRDYPIAEYLEDLAGTGVVASVYVQTNWGPGQGLDEARWVSEVADATGWPAAIVAYADMTVDDVRPALAALAAYPRVRGVRMQLHWHENPQYRFAADPALVAAPAVRANVARLAEHGWTFDLQVFASQMADAAALARSAPDVTFVLQHCGMPEDRSPAGIARWRDGMARLADCPNVTVKLTAQGTFVHRLDPELIAAVLSDTHAAFGAERCLFGSNFPIEKLWTTFPALVAAWRRAIAAYPEAEQRAMLAGTTQRVYRL